MIEASLLVSDESAGGSAAEFLGVVQLEHRSDQAGDQLVHLRRRHGRVGTGTKHCR